MSGLLLDTHVWIWYAGGHAELRKPVVKKITDALHNNHVYVAAISLWEIAMLDKKRRITLEMPCLEWINKSVRLTRMSIVPMSPEIAVESTSLPGHFHGDPADQLIVATARVEGLTLVSRDSRILEYSKHHYVSTIKA